MHRSVVDERGLGPIDYTIQRCILPHFKTWRPKISWTDDELDLLLKCALVYKSKCEYEGLSWEGTRTKYEKIKELILERNPDKPSDNPNKQFPRVGKTEFITKERVSAKLKKMRTDCG